MRANDIAALLARDAENIARMLLPGGKRKGAEWVIGSLDGEAGDSLKVHLTGPKAGRWADFATGDKGDLVGLWIKTTGLSVGDACKAAKEHLSIREDRIAPPAKTYRRPARDGLSGLSDEHRRWLVDERKIDPESVRAYRLASKGGMLVFPYLRDGELVAVKYRRLPKQFSQEADCEPCLFGWQVVPSDARVALICEGEMDALAWHSYGVPALSVPIGAGKAGKHTWLENEFERLAIFDTIFLSMDGDGPGQEAEADLVERLGRERVRVVRLPHKDANECLIRGVPAQKMIDCLTDAKTCDPSELRDVSEFEDAIWQEYGLKDDGLHLPWRKTWDHVKLREGETSIWAGVNGHGKSTVISYVAGALAVQGVPTCVASMEYRPPMWLMRMNRQVAGVSAPSEAFCRHITRKLAGNLKAFTVSGSAKASRLLDVMRYARRRYRIELFVIDNLTKCGFADDDYAAQKDFVEALSDFARDERTHVAIVAHMKKSDDEMRPAGKMAVKGSGGITDMVDTVFEVWRNKPRERAIERAKADGGSVEPKYADAPDTLLLVHKQRFNGEEPTIALWYDKDTTQFLAAPSHRPRPMVEFSVISSEALA